MSILRRLFRRGPEPRGPEHTGAFSHADRDGVGWVRCSAARPDVRVIRRIVRRARLRSGDRVEFDVVDGWAHRLVVTRRAAA